MGHGGQRHPTPEPVSHRPGGWWLETTTELCARFRTDGQGLTRRQAASRLRRHGPNRLRGSAAPCFARRVSSRLTEPLTLVLLGASLIASMMGDAASFGFIALMVTLSVSLDLFQERRAGQAVEALAGAVAVHVDARRDGRRSRLPAERLVPGDCVELSAGDCVPADGRMLQTTDFFVNQAALTGEAFPVEVHAPGKDERPDGAMDTLHAPGAALMGSTVVRGAGRLLVCATGDDTELGRIAGSLARSAPPGAFERGSRDLGRLLTRASIILVLAALFVNLLHHRNLMESFMFSVALAVGLTPELLPMIISVTLAGGAKRLAARQVIVKRLSAIQDLGAMDVLCTDKTGTLTEASLRVESAMDGEGRDCARVFELAWLNSHFQSGLRSPLDDAILARGGVAPMAWVKSGEVPFDFERRRASVLLEAAGRRILVVKGAPEDVLRVSNRREGESGGPVPLTDTDRARLETLLQLQGRRGLRLLAVASREVDASSDGVSADTECELVFAGFVAFSDPPKASAAGALRALREHGVDCKIITGDHEAVALHLCASLDWPVANWLTGQQLAAMDDAALRAAVSHTALFCRVTPVQKERIVRALKQRGHVVGYLGDGINDAPSLHTADVGISVDGAVDVAKQAASLVLTRPDLGVLMEGVREGRRTLLNTTKYLEMATSSNFGNMVSMAVAAWFLPFLPMLPVQVLLNNFLYDLSELAIPTDRVADEDLRAPQRWDASYIRKFMLCFGPLSSAFDLLTFYALHGLLGVGAAQFQTAWFVESLATQVLVIFVIRSRRAAWRDRPSQWLAAASACTVAAAAALPYTAWGSGFGLVPLAWPLLALIVAMTLAYLCTAEAVKRGFHRRTAARSGVTIAA